MTEEEALEEWDILPEEYNVSSDNAIIYAGTGDKIDDVEYYIQSGKIKNSDYIISIMQYTLNYLP